MKKFYDEFLAVSGEVPETLNAIEYLDIIEFDLEEKHFTFDRVRYTNILEFNGQEYYLSDASYAARSLLISLTNISYKFEKSFKELIWEACRYFEDLEDYAYKHNNKLSESAKEDFAEFKDRLVCIVSELNYIMTEEN